MWNELTTTHFLIVVSFLEQTVFQDFGLFMDRFVKSALELLLYLKEPSYACILTCASYERDCLQVSLLILSEFEEIN